MKHGTVSEHTFLILLGQNSAPKETVGKQGFLMYTRPLIEALGPQTNQYEAAELVLLTTETYKNEGWPEGPL